jgi:Protein of unknown function (DUF3800)
MQLCVKSQSSFYVYIAYLDDSGSDGNSPIVVVGAALIADHLFPNIEGAAGTIAERLIPEEKMDEFEEFHAADLYYGHGVFKEINAETRHKSIQAMLSFVAHQGTPIVYSAVDKKKLTSAAYGGADPVDLAFRMCALGIERWIEDNNNSALCLLIMDETKDGHLKAAIRNGFKALRGRLRPPEWSAKRLWRVHDDMYFGDSRDSVGIQVADLCNYFLKRKLEGKNDTDQFYKFYARNLVCSKAEPEWTQLKGIFLEHADDDGV